MLIRHHGRDLSVSTTDPDATVADLLGALEPGAPPGPVWVEGRRIGPATPLDRAGIHHGAEVHTTSGAARQSDDQGSRASATLRLRFVTGADTGTSIELAPGRRVLGRRPPGPGPALRDRTISATHLSVDVSTGPGATVTITDLGSTNGTRLDGRPVSDPAVVASGSTVVLGAARAVVEPTPGRRHPPSAGAIRRDGRPTVPRHRTGRQDRPPDPVVLVLPAPPAPAPVVAPVGWVALVLSSLGALIMVAVLGSWTYAAFAALGPLTMVAHSLDGRRRRRRGARRHRRRLRRALHRLEGDLGGAASVERRRRATLFADPFAPGVDLDPDHPTCWERRLDHPDALQVRIGHGSGPWRPSLAGDSEPVEAPVRDLLDRHQTLDDVAIGLRLEAGQPVAVVGPVDVARGLARSVVLAAATAHGPADLAVAALWSDTEGDADPDADRSWDWLGWLPHAAGPDGVPLLAGDPSSGRALAELLEGEPASTRPTGPTGSGGATGATGATGPACTLTIIDHPAGLRDRRGPARSLLRLASEPTHSVLAVVVLPPDAPVPARCATVLRVSEDGRLDAPPSIAVGPALVAATPRDVAADLARRLARFDDPERCDRGRDLPATVRLSDLLGISHATPDAALARWRAAGPDPAPTATIGVTADGPLRLDLAADGPHVLVAGTTGAGKSELLRSLVLSLAATSSPDHLAFVFVDFKGGSAFDALAHLPHAAGMVTDLDDHLAARALRCLEAELRERERRLRAAGATDLADLRRQQPGGEPLPRLVVVVDEFAALRAAVPDFVDSLVDVAQRGRSLGVHLVLATQRPAGAVSPAIEANVGLRICLRVQTTQDSIDVIAGPEAATLPRRLPGRALVRLGPGEVMATQVATSDLPARAESLGGIRLRPLGPPRPPGPDGPPPDTVRTGPNLQASDSGPPTGSHTELQQLVDVLAQGWRRSGGRPPRRPWPAPLPSRVPWPVNDLHPVASDLVLGLADDPDRQRIRPFSWDLSRGPILGLGLPGAGCATLAATAALEAARSWGSHGSLIQVVDAGPGELAVLAGLAAVGAVVTAHQYERQRRLLQALGAELDRRRADPGVGNEPRLVVIHGVSSLRSRWEDHGDPEPWSRLLELATTGAACGLHLCLTSEGNVPHQLLAACEQRVLFRLGDPAEVAAHGIPSRWVPALPADRAVTVADGTPTVVHLARPADGLASAVAALAADHPVPPPSPGWVGVLPRRLTHHDLDQLTAEAGATDGAAIGSGAADETAAAPARSRHRRQLSPAVEPGDLRLPLGLADRRLEIAALVLPPGGHALVAGPPRSGRTTALIRLAVAAVDGPAGTEVRWVTVEGEPPPLPEQVVAVDAGDADAISRAADHAGPLLVLVDDADRTEDHHGAITALLAARNPLHHVVVAGRNDRLRSRYGHWTREVRAHGLGLLLVPDLDLDGDLLGIRLPRRPPVDLVTGRGWLASSSSGGGGFVQVALPPPLRRTGV